jgi:hypothetical protein
MVEHQSEALNKTGAPWDMCMTFDFDCEGFDADQYKLYIFPTLFAPTEDTREKISELRRKGKNMLYLHAPFYACEYELSLSPMEENTGIKFERCDLCDNTVRLCFDGAEDVTFDFTNKTLKGDIWHHKGNEPITPIFSPTNLDIVLGRFEENGKPACGLKFRDDGGFDAFSACSPIPAQLLQEFYRYANVFKYTDHTIPVYTSSSFECVYHYEGGRVRLYRPRASFLTDCFTGERHFVDEKGKDLYFEPHETKYFIVEEKES